MSDRSTSPFIDVEKVSSDDEDQLELMKKKLVACKSLILTLKMTHQKRAPEDIFQIMSLF